MAQLASLAAGDVRTVVGRFAELLDDPPRGHQPPQRLPGPRRGHRARTCRSRWPSVVARARRRPSRTRRWREVCHAVATARSWGRGATPGVILSQLLRGVAETIRDHDVVDPGDARRRRSRTPTAWRARPSSDRSRARSSPSRARRPRARRAATDLCALVRGARDASRVRARAHARAAGRARPGGRRRRRRRGAVPAARRAVQRRRRRPAARGAVARRASQVHAPEHARAHHDGSTSATLRYEVMYFLEAPDAAIGGVQGGLGRASATRSSSSAATGSSTATSTPTTSARRSRRRSTSGGPRGIRVTDLAEQVIEERWVREGAFDATDGDGPRPRAAHRRRRGRPGRRHRAHLPLARASAGSSRGASR